MSNDTVYVHVSQPCIKHNALYRTALPTLTVKHPTTGLLMAYEVRGYATCLDGTRSNGEARPLDADGARVWLEFSPDSFEIVGPWFTIDEVLTKAMDTGNKELVGALVTIKTNWLSSQRPPDPTKPSKNGY